MKRTPVCPKPFSGSGMETMLPRGSTRLPFENERLEIQLFVCRLSWFGSEGSLIQNEPHQLALSVHGLCSYEFIQSWMEDNPDIVNIMSTMQCSMYSCGVCIVLSFICNLELI